MILYLISFQNIHDILRCPLCLCWKLGIESIVLSWLIPIYRPVPSVLGSEIPVIFWLVPVPEHKAINRSILHSTNWNFHWKLGTMQLPILLFILRSTTMQTCYFSYDWFHLKRLACLHQINLQWMNNFTDHCALVFCQLRPHLKPEEYSTRGREGTGDKGQTLSSFIK